MNPYRDSQIYRIDEQGNTVWFPYSFWGKGYILTPESEEKIRNHHNSPATFVGTLFAGLYIGLVLAICWQLNLPKSTFYTSLFVPVIAIFMYGRHYVKKRTADLEISAMRLKFTDWLHPELLKNYENLFGLCVIQIFFAVVVLYASVADTLPNPEYGHFGILGIAYSVIHAYLWFRAARYLMYVRHHKKD